MTIAKTVLDLYDVKMIQELKKRFYSVPTEHFILIPSDLALSYASEKFGQALFPMYSIFRPGPPVKNSVASLAAYRQSYNLTPEKSIYQLLVDLTYQVDFWSRDMFEMNKSVLDWFRFEKNPHLSFSFAEVGLPEFQQPLDTVLKMDEPQDNSAIDDIYNIGRYYRYTYTFTMTCLIFDIIKEI
ncbi:MAG: hypothetical protein ABSG25_02355 [Bryobacteraceae bacterium]